MKKGDIIWGGSFFIILVLFLMPASREILLQASSSQPYVAGFIKFAVLATMGDMLGKRIVIGEYQLTRNIIGHAAIWGVIGCMITLVFPVYAGGTGLAQAAGLLPFEGNAFAQAFFGSAVMNLTFAPVMNTFHRITDLWVDARFNQTPFHSFQDLLASIDWPKMVCFNWLKVGVFFWIPVHTIVFMLPQEIRIIVAAFCSIALGIILSFAAKQSAKEQSVNS